LKVGLLRWDQVIGNLIYPMGIIIIIASVAWGFYHSIEREEPE